jgi:hypothetical protein
LVPTKFATGVGRCKEDGEVVPTFITWWMWMGRSFKVHTTELVFN